MTHLLSLARATARVAPTISGFKTASKDFKNVTLDVPNKRCDYPLLANTNTAAINFYADKPWVMPNPNSSEDNADLFKQVIRYHDPNTSIPNEVGYTPQYNGNISQIEWQVAGREAQAYSFKYDYLDRLTYAQYADIHSYTSWDTRGWAGQYETDNKFYENIRYADNRGNIQRIFRKGMNGYNANNNSGSFALIDNLTFTYQSNNLNRVNTIGDASYEHEKGFKTKSNGSSYQYDQNGNLTIDPHKGIQSITYNYLNLPETITFDGVPSENITARKIEFVYDASGIKLSKITTSVQQGFAGPIETITTYNYVNGVEYKDAVLQRLAHTEGAIVLNPNDGTYNHEYVINDHLGNARVIYSDANNDGNLAITDVKQINHYYPFGLNMEGNWNGANGQNKYQYNGKELNQDFGLDWNDYGARFYDAAVVRWWSVDPLSEKSPNQNPYRYGFNNPIRFFDPNGTYEEDGHYWTVFLAASLSGYSRARAWELAYYAQLPDDVRNGEGDMQFPTNTFLPIAYQMSIHALTGGDPNSERQISEMCVRTATNAKVLGGSLHRLGDSYAHTNPRTNKMYKPGLGHGLDGHWPDKIKNRPELYLEYVGHMLSLLMPDKDADMFTFNYVAGSGLDTDGNSAVLETEVSIRNNISTFSVLGNQTSAINGYLDSRKSKYGDLGKYKTHTIINTTVERHYKDKNGKWQKKEEERTFVKFD